jgi:hypothetical protein
VSSNGQLDFGGGDSGYSNTCLPDTGATYAIFAYWDDLYTVNSGHGIYTSISGTAPNRIFNIEWRDQYYPGTGNANFEVRLYEGQRRFDIIYGAVDQSGSSATVGVERNNGDNNFTQFECNTGGLTNGLMVTFTQPTCGTPTTSPTNTPVATDTPVPPSATNTPAEQATNTTSPTATTAAATETATPAPPTPTATACNIQFSDVPVGSTFYQWIHCLVCLGIVNGYPDGTFKPNNNVTRGQLSKIVSNSAGFSDNQTTQMFEDVPLGSTFFQYIGRLASRGLISGYACGGPGEPCQPGHLPYFRPNANATRGQISKIVSNAAGFNNPPVGQQFQDVASGTPFYDYIYRLSTRGIINGYACGQKPNEPCVPPADLPYFRPNANATRGQMSKIDAAAFFPDCNIPSRR